MSDCCENKFGAAYDLAVVGAGSAGFSAAIAATEQGARVALIGSGTIGGTCVNIGCVPSKTLIRAVETLHGARTAARFAGVAAHAELADWQATVRQKDALVAQLRQSKYADLLSAYPNITYHDGPARLVEGGVVAGDKSIAAEKIIVATGARPAIPAISGIEAIPYLTSTSALDLAELPRSLLVIGAGYIGAELAQMFSRAGVAVTLVCRSRLLPQAEPEIGAALAGYLREEGIDIVSGAIYQAIHNTERGVALVIERDGETFEIESEKVLVATGRRPTPRTSGSKNLALRSRQRARSTSMKECGRPGPASMPRATSPVATSSSIWPPMARRSRRRTRSTATPCITTTRPCRRSCSPTRKLRAPA